MRTAQRARAHRSLGPAGARTRRSLQRRPGDWRNRHRHRPEPGGGAGGGGRPSASLNVLLVDDERAIRTICRVNLEGSGIDVSEAVDGSEALERVRDRRPSLVLLDVMMPGVDGWSVAEQLASDPATRDVPVIFLSARAAHEDRLRAQELGAVGYVVKPFDPLQLADLVRDVVERVERGEREALNREISERR